MNLAGCLKNDAAVASFKKNMIAGARQNHRDLEEFIAGEPAPTWQICCIDDKLY